MSLLKNIFPNKGRTKSQPTDYEKKAIKALLDKGYRKQDILQIINHGREDTINYGRLSDSIPKDTLPIQDKELEKFLLIQDSYDHLTGLNRFLETDFRLIKAREAMLAAITNFNSPFIVFKEEIFCTLAIIAWTHLLHEKLERIRKGSSKREGNTYKNCTIKDIIGYEQNPPNVCPIKDKNIIENLRDITQLRDRIEHDIISLQKNVLHSLVPLFQSCCINFDNMLTEWFGKELTLTHHISLALQFSRICNQQLIEIEKSNLPEDMLTIVNKVNSENISNAYALKVYFTSEVTNKTNSDLHKLVSYDDNSETKELVIKKVDTLAQYPYSAKDVVKKVKKRNSEAKQNKIYEILKNIKNDGKYSCYDFINQKRQKDYEKNKEKYISNKTSPPYAKGARYNDKAVNYVIEELAKIE